MKIKLKNNNEVKNFHKWFAWKPIIFRSYTQDYTYFVWLSVVYRRWYDGYGGDYWEYATVEEYEKWYKIKGDKL